MLRKNLQITEFISLAVMLLMVVALISGQSGASAHEFERSSRTVKSAIASDRMRINLDRHIGDKALQISFAIATELNHFRVEDE